MLIKKELCFLAIPCLLSAQSVKIQPQIEAQECTHQFRIPAFGDFPCPDVYNCNDGHPHVCNHRRDGSSQRCTNCDDDNEIQFNQDCPHDPHPIRSCPWAQ
ncbi:hypothetical protein PGT21_032605 [Puccinia graminis f. sp. tritici]|uniref:Chitin-binding type-2 domain-containing protein n=1 Tax=Puccinia graminis f. sp. tritici TaxID=56615 RepID=A0A5B0NRV5_PUCGR|nr:hypothetical protein PGT21_032605 [Puccinia graminis f. sp. tritici]